MKAFTLLLIPLFALDLVSCKTSSSSVVMADDTGAANTNSDIVLSCDSVKTILIKRSTNGELTVETFAPGGPKETDAQIEGMVNSSDVDLTITHHGIVLILDAKEDPSADGTDNRDHTLGNLSLPGKSFPAKCSAEKGFDSQVAINVPKP